MTLVRVVAVALLAAALLPASASAFPGKNGRLAYEGKASAGNDLVLRNSSGSGARKLSTTGRPSRPAFSAAGVRIAYAARRRIWVMQADGSNRRQLTNGYTAGDGDPAWSPTGAALAYTSGPSGARDIFTVGLDGNDVRRVTSVVADEYSPAWSSRDRIAFVRKTDAGDGDLYEVAGTGGAARRLTRGAADDRDPAWSPDGRRIAFTRDSGGRREVYLANSLGHHIRRLRRLPANAASPVWSPDGRFIAFAMGRTGKRAVWVMRTNGKGIRRVVGSGADARALDWQAKPGDPVVAAAGDIACDPSSPAWNDSFGTSTGCHERYTSDLLLEWDLAGVLMLGDTQYEDGAYGKFLTSYDPTWGRLKPMTHPVIGNHEYWEPTASGYWDYFNGQGVANGPAGTRGQGWYSFDVGTWHVITLNSNCSFVSCAAGGPQERWLREDLLAHPRACTLALLHHPLFASGLGDEGATAAVRPLWQALHDANADVVLSGHDHAYERFAPVDPNGVPDPARGIREFISGVGGKSIQQPAAIRPNSEVRNGSSFGVLRLTLRSGGYDWEFVPDTAGGFTDAGSAGCH